MNANERVSTLLTAGTLLGGRYKLVRKLGDGGMAIVCEGIDTRLRKPVAIKMLRSEMLNSNEAVERFKTEALAAAQIRDPGILDVTDFIEEDGLLFMITELLRGEDLSDHLSRVGNLSEARALGILEHVFRAIGKAHDKGITHRDLKPENIYLARESTDDDERVKILDFGIAKIHESSNLGPRQQTQLKRVLGTPWFMSPEQLQGHSVSHETDVWALGVMLYQMITGMLPFDVENATAQSPVFCGLLLGVIERGEGMSLMSRISPPLQKFIKRCLSISPAERPSVDEALSFIRTTLGRNVDSASIPPLAATKDSGNNLPTVDEESGRATPDTNGSDRGRIRGQSIGGWASDHSMNAAERPVASRGNKRMLAGAMLTVLIVVGGGLGGLAVFHKSPPQRINTPAPRAAQPTIQPAPTPIALPALVESAPPLVMEPTPPIAPQVAALPEPEPAPEQRRRHARRGDERHDDRRSTPRPAAVARQVTAHCEDHYHLNSAGQCCRTVQGAVDCDGTVLH